MAAVVAGSRAVRVGRGPRAAGWEETAGRRVAVVTAAVNLRAGKKPVSTGSGAAPEACNGGAGLLGASVSPTTRELLGSRWDPVVTVSFVAGQEAAVTCVAFPALRRRPGDSAVR